MSEKTIDAGKMKELLSDKRLKASERQEIDSAEEISAEARVMLEDFLKKSSGGVEFEKFKAKILGNIAAKKPDADDNKTSVKTYDKGTSPLKITPLQRPSAQVSPGTEPEAEQEPKPKETNIRKEFFESKQDLFSYLVEVVNVSELIAYKTRYNTETVEEGIKKFLEFQFGIKSKISMKIENGKVSQLTFDTNADVIPLKNNENGKLIYDEKNIDDGKIYLVRNDDLKKDFYITGVELLRMRKERIADVEKAKNIFDGKGFESKQDFVDYLIALINEKVIGASTKKEEPNKIKEAVLSYLAIQFGFNPEKISLELNDSKVSKLEFDPKKMAIKLESDAKGNPIMPKNIPDYKVFVLTKDGKDTYYTSEMLKKNNGGNKPEAKQEATKPETKKTEVKPILDITPNFENGVYSRDNFLDGILKYANREFNFSGKSEVYSSDGKIVSGSNSGAESFMNYLRKNYGITGNIRLEIENGKLVNVGFDELKDLAGKLSFSSDKREILFPENIPENRLFSLEKNGETLILTSKAVKSFKEESQKLQKEKEKKDNETTGSEIKTALEGYSLANISSKIKDLNAEKFSIWTSYFSDKNVRQGISLPTSINEVTISGNDATISFDFDDFGPNEEFNSNLKVTLSGVVENNKLKIPKEDLTKLFEAQILSKTIPEIFAKLPEKKS